MRSAQQPLAEIETGDTKVVHKRSMVADVLDQAEELQALDERHE